MTTTPARDEGSVPEFSLVERDRRWSHVRQLMARSGIDVVVAIGEAGGFERKQSDARYLTQLGRNGEEVSVVFPLDGDVVAIMRIGGPTCGDSWIGEVRASAGWDQATTLVEALQEMHADGKTIGVCGLSGGDRSLVRYPDGVVNHGIYERVRTALPRATFVNANPVMEEARWIKSEEEVDFLRQATALAEAGIHTVATLGSVGVREPELYAHMIAAVVRGGGNLPMFTGWTSGPAMGPFRPQFQPVERVLEAGDMVRLELEARYGGYFGQADDTVFVGTPPRELREAQESTFEVFDHALTLMRPGISFGELVDACERDAGGRITNHLTLHGRGAGDDGPLVVMGRISDQLRARPLEAGNVFILKPTSHVDGTGFVGLWGDSVVVRSQGGERLGRRPQAILQIG